GGGRRRCVRGSARRAGGASSRSTRPRARPTPCSRSTASSSAGGRPRATASRGGRAMWRSLARNALANVGGTLVGLVVGFVTMPLVVHHLGPAQFGLWVLATGIVGYVGVLDLGLAPTLVNEAAALLPHDTFHDASQGASQDPSDAAFAAAADARRRLGETASTIFALYAALRALA